MMRLPWLQIDQDALVRARTLAGLLSLPCAHGYGIAIALFSWAVEMASENDLTGQITDENPAEVVSAAVGWSGEPEKLYRALCRVGFVEKTSGKIEDGFDRIRGLDRYRSALEERKKDRDRKSVGFRRKSGGIPPESTRKSKSNNKSKSNKDSTYVSTYVEPEASNSVSAMSATSLPENVVVTLERPEKPDEQWLGDDFWQWAQFKRQNEAGLPVEKRRPVPRELGAWWSKLKLEGYSTADIRRGFITFSGDQYWQGAKPPLPFAGFLSQWDKYVIREEPSRAAL